MASWTWSALRQVQVSPALPDVTSHHIITRAFPGPSALCMNLLFHHQGFEHTRAASWPSHSRPDVLRHVLSTGQGYAEFIQQQVASFMTRGKKVTCLGTESDCGWANCGAKPHQIPKDLWACNSSHGQCCRLFVLVVRDVFARLYFVLHEVWSDQ